MIAEQELAFREGGSGFLDKAEILWNRQPVRPADEGEATIGGHLDLS
jgi:hypothetical protein